MKIFQDYTFVRELAQHLVESSRIPKVQVERIAGPILSIFIEKLISAVTNRPVRLLSPEFPLRKEGNHQSTNIDWLLIDQQQETLFIVELKTDADSENHAQLGSYTAVKERISGHTARFLMDDLHSIGSHAGAKENKYRYIIENKIGSAAASFQRIRSAKIIYIVPNALKTEELTKNVDIVVTLTDLADRYGDIASKEWQIIAGALKQIDGSIHYVPRPISLPEGKTQSNSTAAAAAIKKQHRSPKGLTPAVLWIGRSGGNVGPRPNYQIQYTNGDVVPYRFSGKVFDGVDRFKQGNLTDAIPWETID